jgi:signal transduction histidine kinase/ActR/RegA family two-component response regulator
LLWGIGAGIALAVLNIFCISLSIHIITPQMSSIFSTSAAIGMSIHFGLVLIFGAIGAFQKKLKTEIEERKNAEAKLIQYQNQLERIIKERTTELEKAYIRINQSEKLQAIGQLAGGVAHDFNNKLTIILGYCELLRKKLGPSSPLYSYVDQIRICGQLSSGLTKQLLAFARKDVFESGLMNMIDIINEVVGLISRSLPKNIQIDCSHSSLKPFVWGGISQIQSAILNIILNARDAMPCGGTLTIKTTDCLIDDAFKSKSGLTCKNGDYVAITMSDTGCGMTPEVQTRIFEPFFTTKGEGKGTGMGLAAVYGTVESHNGAISVNSIADQGTTFTIYLPFSAKKPALAKVAVSNDNYCKNEHILVVDDEQKVADILKTMLENTGYKVTVAHSGAEAIDIYKEMHTKINAIVLDMSMPGMTGLETFKILKDINPQVTALLISGYILDQQIETAIKSGISAFLQKPLSQDELHSSIQKALND